LSSSEWIGSRFGRCEGAVLYIDAGTDSILLLFLCLSQCNFYVSDVDMLGKLNRSRYQIDIFFVFHSWSCVVLHMWLFYVFVIFQVVTHVLFHSFFWCSYLFIICVTS
jgi:hypothetical protein